MTPFNVNDVGLALAPEYVPLNPIWVEPFVASDPFQAAFVTLT